MHITVLQVVSPPQPTHHISSLPNPRSQKAERNNITIFILILVNQPENTDQFLIIFFRGVYVHSVFLPTSASLFRENIVWVQFARLKFVFAQPGSSKNLRSLRLTGSKSSPSRELKEKRNLEPSHLHLL